VPETALDLSSRNKRHFFAAEGRDQREAICPDGRAQNRFALISPLGSQSLHHEAVSCDRPAEMAESKRKFRINPLLALYFLASFVIAAVPGYAQNPGFAPQAPGFTQPGLAAQALALHNWRYVQRPQGWFILVAPLTEPNQLTGKRHVDLSTPQARWPAMVVRGRDGHNYDFASNDDCVRWKRSMGLDVYQNAHPGKAGDYHDAKGVIAWVDKSRCARDDNRQSVITNNDWSKAVARYFKQHL
jgi:hypothetical protein